MSVVSAVQGNFGVWSSVIANVKFNLPVGSLCITYEFDEGDLVYGSYTYINRPSYVFLVFSYTVRSQHSTIVVRAISAVDSHEVWRNYDTQKMSGELGFTASERFEYEFCFTQTMKVYTGFRPAKMNLQIKSKKLRKGE